MIVKWVTLSVIKEWHSHKLLWRLFFVPLDHGRGHHKAFQRWHGRYVRSTWPFPNQAADEGHLPHTNLLNHDEEAQNHIPNPVHEEAKKKMAKFATKRYTAPRGIS
jgi:hypothetical protein